jgi:hypothetical protein
MSLDDMKKSLSLEGIREKIFKIKNMYQPNLIANLSKEMYELYLIRDSICNQLLELLKENDIDIDKVHDFIKEKIKNSKKRLKIVKNGVEAEELKVTVEEWKQFL